MLTEDDLAICDLGDRRKRRAYAVNDEAHESSLHREHSPDQDTVANDGVSGATLQSAGEAAEYADLARRLEDLMGDEE